MKKRIVSGLVPKNQNYKLNQNDFWKDENSYIMRNVISEKGGFSQKIYIYNVLNCPVFLSEHLTSEWESNSNLKIGKVICWGLMKAQHNFGLFWVNESLCFKDDNEQRTSRYMIIELRNIHASV